MSKIIREQLSSYAYVMGSTMYANFMLSLVVVGIQCFMCFYTLSVFLETPRAVRKGRTPYVVLSFIIFGIFSLASAFDAYYIFYALSRKDSADWVAFWKLIQKDLDESYWPRFLSSAAITTWIAIGDGLLLYRCYILWYGHRWVLILPGLTYFGTIATGITIDALTNTSTFNDAKAGVANTILATSTNVLITFLILFRLIQARRRLGKVLASDTAGAFKLPYMSGITSILIESALPLAFFGILHMIPTLAGALPRNQTFEALRALNGVSAITAFFFYSFYALSPQMIIFKVATGKSWMRPSEATQEALSHSLAFAHSHPVSRGDLESRVESIEGSGSDITREKNTHVRD